MCVFVGIDLVVENVLDVIMLLKFWRLLFEYDLMCKLFDEIGILLCECGLMMKEGILVDVMIIEVLLLIKNVEKSCDLEMYQMKKGNVWYFGMKVYFGVDVDLGLVYSVVGMVVNVLDVLQVYVLLYGYEEEVFGDVGYIGVDKCDEMNGKLVKWCVVVKCGKIKVMQDGLLKDLVIMVE